ncbi:hypothetical protein BDB00DRAFT_960437 [Zychaea mexicana]|uniref:uncharacterized protein n=1 Tax=Zychaea mexicana TaxID=64656 RepID=UPI0022FE1B53|nr:uncharacterized protein BDB00DRAFT_960437 [Zychaea mexicana]KAI9490933.1 hypothetical protein BDB00DRAFT_960437 [Zychaea mexicana]
MLHVQESSHSTLLLGPMLTPPVHPQPTTSTSSRTTRVVEQLQDTLDNLQKELISTRSQLETARQAKAQSELDAHNYVESNKKYRTDIQGLMQTLEVKQQVLDTTKKSSMAMEAQVKKLRDEALASRKKLEELRRKEQVLERDRNVAVAEKEQTERQHIVLKESVARLSTRFEREAAGLRQDLTSVQDQVSLMSERGKLIAQLSEQKIKQCAAERKELIAGLEIMRVKMQENLQRFVQQMRAEIGPLLDDVNQSTSTTKDFEYAVLRCRGEVNGLVARIRAYTAEAYGVE